MSKRQTLVLPQKSVPETLPKEVSVQEVKSETNKTSADIITIPGVYMLKNNKLVVITDVDPIRRVGMDATGQEWNFNGIFSLGTHSETWNIDSFICRIPGGK